jgi:hypothetical protein
MVITSARALLATTAIVVALFLDHAGVRAQSTPRTADCQAPAWGNEPAAFEARLEAYVALRTQLETSLQARGRALAERIRTARAEAKQGDLLTPALSVEIRKSLRRELNAHVWKVIMDDNPGELPSQVNDEYREGQPLSTMPSNMLAALPKLPRDIEYRFIERHLVLLDTRAKIILDRIPYAIQYADSQRSCR